MMSERLPKLCAPETLAHAGHLVASLLVVPALPFTLPWASDSLPVLFPPPGHEAGCGWEEGLEGGSSHLGRGSRFTLQPPCRRGDVGQAASWGLPMTLPGGSAGSST